MCSTIETYNLVIIMFHCGERKLLLILSLVITNINYLHLSPIVTVIATL